MKEDEGFVWNWSIGDDMSDSRSRSSGVWTGVLILLLGVAALIKASVTGVPDWIFSWPMFLVLLGLVLAIKHRFNGIAWFILILVGWAFLVPQIAPELNLRRYIWPVALISIGGFIILKRIRYSYQSPGSDEKKSSVRSDIEDAKVVNETTNSREDFVNVTSIFAGTKKNILSKNFKGGNITNIMGGTEIYLGQADIQSRAVIDTTTIMGGLKLIVPSNWTIKSEAAVIFGGIEDKRFVTPTTDGSEKVLVIKGTVLFGGVDIKSY